MLSAAALAVILPACGSSSGGPSVPARPAGIVSDSGFRPGQNGLPFENYGDSLANGSSPDNMTAADVQRMFGDAVCVDAQSRKCDLIPEAQDWLDEINQAMAGGHCYGFSVLADLLWQNKVTATTFGAPTVTALQISGNTVLQRQIAYDWALQTIPAVQSQRIQGTPNKILLTLISSLKGQAYTILFWKRDGTGGHAVTPYAVVSKGGGKYDVLIYDNNWPNQRRAISFDTTSNSWSYEAATISGEAGSLYEGDAKTKTMSLDPVSPALGTQKCPFCGKVPQNASAASTGGGGNVATVSLTGSGANHANLVVTDDAGHKTGYINGKYVDQIRGAYDAPIVSNEDWTNRAEPDFYVPADQRYTFTLDASRLSAPDTETINIIGPSYDLAVKNIVMRPGERDTLVVDPDATLLSYRSSRPESPTIDLGVSDDQADYSFEVTGVSEKPGSTLNLMLPAEGNALRLQAVGAGSAATVGLKMTRETEQGVQAFPLQSVRLAAGDQASLGFGEWTSPTQAAPLEITHQHTATAVPQ